MSSSPNLTQYTFRVRTDSDLVDNTPTWGAGENFPYSIAVETPFRIRFSVSNSGTAAAAGPFILRVSKNAGAYTAVTTTSGATLGAQSNDSSSSADEAAIATANFRLLSPGWTKVVGVYDETGSATKSLTNAFETELEYGLILKTAGAAAGNTFDFRLYNSTTAFTTYNTNATPRVTVVDNNRACLANDVLSASSVTKPTQLKQEHALLANDVASPSSISKPVMAMRLDLLANDVTSASSVSQPAAVIRAQQALLANDVSSASSVTQPSVQQRQALLANDVKSASSVGQPAVKQAHGVLANDVTSASSAGQPAAVIGRALLANDVTSASSVSQPNADEIVTAGEDNLLANDIVSASGVGQPAAVIGRDILANDVLSASSVTTPNVAQRQVLDAVDVTSASSVTTPIAGEIEAGSILAEDVVSASSVSTPTLVVEGGEVQPDLPRGGAGDYVYHRRRRPEDEEERERREARLRDLAHAIDRAVARVRTELASEPEPEIPAPVAVAAIDDGLAAIQDSLRVIEALGSRLLEVDAELASLWQSARTLAAQAVLADDEEALELLLTGRIEERMTDVPDDDEEALELLLAA